MLVQQKFTKEKKNENHTLTNSRTKCCIIELIHSKKQNHTLTNSRTKCCIIEFIHSQKNVGTTEI